MSAERTVASVAAKKRALAAVFASASSVALYFVTTQGQPFEIVFSSIAVNFLINCYAADRSLNHLSQLWDRGSYKTFIATVIAAAGLSAPQALIAYLDASEDSAAVKILAPLSTAVGTSVLNGLALEQLSDFWSAGKDFFYGVHSVRTNLATLLELWRMVDYNAINPEEICDLLAMEDGEKKYLAVLKFVMERVSSTLERPSETGKLVHYAAESAAFLLKASIAVVMIFTVLAYSCGTAVAMQKDFKLFPMASAGLANAFNAPFMLLCINGAFSLGSGLINLSKSMMTCSIPTKLKLGALGMITTSLAPILAGGLSFYSGFTTESLMAKCSNTTMSALDEVPSALSIADVSSAVFNAVYALKCLQNIFAVLVKLCAGEKVSNYLLISEILEEIQKKAKADPEGFLRSGATHSSADKKTKAADPEPFLSSVPTNSSADDEDFPATDEDVMVYETKRKSSVNYDGSDSDKPGLNELAEKLGSQSSKFKWWLWERSTSKPATERTFLSEPRGATHYPV